MYVKNDMSQIIMEESKNAGVNVTINTPTAIVIAGAFIALAIYMSNTPATSPTQTTNTAGVQTGVTPQTTPTVSQVSLDDDPVLGNPDAPVTIVEFSDYECPFCKRHFENSFPQLKAEYIDTGKVKLVFRDLPLTFHDPLATTQAMAASCAREQGGDEAYYKYHHAIFETTNSNGNGMTVEQVYDLANDLNLNRSDIKTCVESDKYKEEILADIQGAQVSGASATPTFFVGPSSNNGMIEGTRIVGAQPYEAIIKPAIEKALTEAGA